MKRLRRVPRAQRDASTISANATTARSRPFRASSNPSARLEQAAAPEPGVYFSRFAWHTLKTDVLNVTSITTVIICDRSKANYPQHQPSWCKCCNESSTGPQAQAKNILRRRVARVNQTWWARLMSRLYRGRRLLEGQAALWPLERGTPAHGWCRCTGGPLRSTASTPTESQHRVTTFWKSTPIGDEEWMRHPWSLPCDEVQRAIPWLLDDELDPSTAWSSKSICRIADLVRVPRARRASARRVATCHAHGRRTLVAGGVASARPSSSTNARIRVGTSCGQLPWRPAC